MSAPTARAQTGLAARAKGWFAISRVPFLSVGVLPYLLGARIALWSGVEYRAPVFWLGLAGVLLIMLATYFNGEYYDVGEDTISTELGRNPFAGGSGGVIDGLLPAHHARIAGNVAAALAVVVGLVLALVFRTGVWTIPMGLFGLAAGYFYSAPPLRWVQRGIGEVFIGICYGWLPVAIGYYLLGGELPVLLLWVSLPVAITIFNVIFVNEYPDYEGDVIAGKRNLLLRLGLERGIWVYVAAVVSAWATFAWALTHGVPSGIWPWYAAVAVVSGVPAAMMLAGKWRVRKLLEPICGLTIVTNLATTAVLTAAFWQKG
jgi:1,4-dihydroxy-2-naphthoate octaprenyltransferase